MLSFRFFVVSCTAHLVMSHNSTISCKQVQNTARIMYETQLIKYCEFKLSKLSVHKSNKIIKATVRHILTCSERLTVSLAVSVILFHQYCPNCCQNNRNLAHYVVLNLACMNRDPSFHKKTALPVVVVFVTMKENRTPMFPSVLGYISILAR